MYDIIGDIHGFAKTLEALLQKLGYSKTNDVYSHPQRKVIFVGDFIDRGPGIRECLQIIKPMIDNGTALSVMGNHEYNAICYHTASKNNNGWLRERNPKNIKQHSATIAAFADFPSEWETYLEWFMTLPLFLDLEQIRIVHACWDEKIIESLNSRLNGCFLNKDFIHQSSIKGSEEYHLIENLLKGFELILPDNIKYRDKDGFERAEIRVKWWKQLNSETYKSISVNGNSSMPEIKVIPSDLGSIPVYPQNEPPVFIGHYWNSGTPKLMAPNVCCIDYSVAFGQNLVAYRWNGEIDLLNENFISQDNLDVVSA